MQIKATMRSSTKSVRISKLRLTILSVGRDVDQAAGGRDYYQRAQKTLGVTDTFISLTVEMFSWRCMHANPSQIVHLKHAVCNASIIPQTS